ncbi:glutathione-disulfide reductase [Pseudooceanicola aestuarii]|uniref:glutathione-disulfide reductase n=1 Tax=Pseudooceanicola aestuarii TaxID=2697319 RepID=UPI0013D2D1DC|nr:glutathione-disulfide reductase [Pseudooceanicola aestuarii]
MSEFDYDLFVIGGGSGGVRAARVAAGEADAKVALAESSRYGGTCVIRGCVPKKLMVFASGYKCMFEDARAYGWEVDEGAFDWTKFHGRLSDELDRLEGVYKRLLDNSGVDRFDGRATIVDPHTVQLGNGVKKTAKHILVATGGRPILPPIKGAEHGLVSDDVFLLDKLPNSVLIVGGGYIGCEFAGIFNGLGVEVTQYLRGAQILNGFDEEARGLISEEMRQGGIDLHTGTNILEMEPRDGGTWVKSSNGDERVFDHVIFATGRAPNTEKMGLEDVGVELDDKGAIVVDGYSQTAVPSIYAIGDVTDRLQLTPVAIREGMAFVETVFKGNPTSPDHDLVPTAIFTQPEMGTIGLTEEEAAAQEPIEVYCTSFKAMQQAFAGRTERVMMKLLVSKETRKVLGCHIVAPQAGEMIQIAGIAVKMGATKEDFDRVCAVHPTMAEELVTMRSPTRET